MKTSQVVKYADPDGLATTSLDLDFVLRHKVVPDFFSLPDSEATGGIGGVGFAGWRRRVFKIVLAIGDQQFDLPVDFGSVKSLGVGVQTTQTQPLDFSTGQLAYIGDQPDLVMNSLVATGQVQPTGWFLQFTPVGGGSVHPVAGAAGYRTVFLTAPIDQPYTVQVIYYNYINFIGDSDDVDLNQYIPQQFQWALVEGCKRELYATRLSQDDDRYQLADSEWKRIILAARRDLELGGATKIKRVS